MNLPNFPERLSELIFERGLNALSFSKEFGCADTTISEYLKGLHLPTAEMAVRLADYFNCTVDFLLGIKDENKATKFKPCPPFSERLAIFCKECNTTRYKIQQKTGISESNLRYWAQGKCKPSILGIVRIAEKYDVSVDFVLGREI